MKILVCHNYYQQPGGEDQSFAHENKLLTEHGHVVVPFTVHNDSIDARSRLAVAAGTLWSRDSYAAVRDLIHRERPDVLHCTNTFPLLSPSIYYAARREGVPVVQSLRNYRLLCPGAFLLRDGRVCEDCLGRRIAWPAIVHRCYRQSRGGSAAVAGMLAWHRLIGTWRKAVDVYYALTEFGRSKFIEGGLPAEKILVKPNFVHPDPGVGRGGGGYAVYVGRLSAEKGIETLLVAWKAVRDEIPLKIVGDGPLAGRVQEAAAEDSRIEWLGRRSPVESGKIVAEASFSIVPSVWYEGEPRTIHEAYARGTPVIASRLGAMIEGVVDGRTGRHFVPGDSASLAGTASDLFADQPALAQMRLAARRHYETHYSPGRNYELLMEIYARALAERN